MDKAGRLPVEAETVNVLSKGDGRLIGWLLALLCLIVIGVFYAGVIKSMVGGLLAIVLTGIPAWYLLTTDTSHCLYIENAVLHWRCANGKSVLIGEVAIQSIDQLEHNYVARKDGHPVTGTSKLSVICHNKNKQIIPSNVWSRPGFRVIYERLKHINPRIKFAEVTRSHGDW